MNFCELSFEKSVKSAEKNRYAESSISGAVNGEYSLLQTIKIDYNNPLCAPLQEQMYHTTSFECVAAEWLRMAGAQLKESSIVKYLNVLNHYLLPRYSGVPINEITRKNVTEYVQFLLTSGGCNGTGLSANTIFGILSVLKSIFFFASAEKQISVENITKLPIKQGSTKMVLLSADEQSVLSEYLTQNPNPRDIGILLSLFAGLRLGEVCALRWCDISNSTISVHSSMQRIQTFDSSGKKTKIVISTPKSNCSVRSIPIPKHLSEIVECSRGEAESFVISNSKSNIVEPRSMENYYKGVLKKCGLKPTNYHALRHTFATRCIELGFDVKSLSEILGHSNVNITMNRYVHPSMELKQKNMNMLCVFLPMSHTT